MKVRDHISEKRVNGLAQFVVVGSLSGALLGILAGILPYALVISAIWFVIPLVVVGLVFLAYKTAILPLRCPYCQKNLYWTVYRDCYRHPMKHLSLAFAWLPDTIKQCPHCYADFDGEYQTRT